MKNVIRMKSRMKGFSLVELVVVILIIAVLAVAVFAGGSASIRKAQVSRVSSDLHNFDIAMSTYMNENRSGQLTLLRIPKKPIPLKAAEVGNREKRGKVGKSHFYPLS